MHANISRRINAERLMLPGWSRAILLQLAHPLVANRLVTIGLLPDEIREQYGFAWSDGRSRRAPMNAPP